MECCVLLRRFGRHLAGSLRALGPVSSFAACITTVTPTVPARAASRGASLRRLLASLLLVGAGSHALAALVSYEGFGYASGSNLNGASGGSGFSANWLAEAGVGVASGGLSWPNMPAGSTGSTYVASASYTATYRTFANRAGTDTWVAFLFRRDSNSNGDCNVMIGSGISEVGIAAGAFGGTGGIRIGSGGPMSRLTTAPASTPFAIGLNDPVTDVDAIGRTRLIVLHLDYASATAGTIRVYLDPDLSQALGSPNYSSSFTLSALDRIAFKGSTPFTVDEIRVGDMFYDVVGNNDPDGDLLTTELEATLGSNPLVFDTDSDGFNDATEYLNGSNLNSDANVPGTTRIERVFGSGAARGLDLSGNFVYAFNVGPTGAAGQAGDANFTADNAPGITVQAPNNPIANWNNPNFGSTAADNVLETVYQSIRWTDRNWSAPDKNLRVDLANLTVGRNYKLQLLFGEAGQTGRRFDVLLNGSLLANDFAPTDAQGSASMTTAGSAVVHEFTATSTTLNIVLDGSDVASVPSLNTDPYINGATLEALPTAPIANGENLNRPGTTRVTKVLVSTLLGNDSDPDGDSVTLTAVGNALPAGATVELVGNFAVYTAPASNSGNGSFTYTLSDGALTGTATVTVTETTGPGASGPNSASATAVGADIALKFLGVPGRTYGVQYTTQSSPPYTWNELPGPVNLVAPASGVLSHIDVNPAEPLRLYRAVLR
jgi:hypothetical protein